MGIFSKDIKTMDDLFVHQLRDMYYAENQILQALPTMIDKATDASLKQTFQSHLNETKNQVTRLEQVFKMHGVEVKGKDGIWTFTSPGLDAGKEVTFKV